MKKFLTWRNIVTVIGIVLATTGAIVTLADGPRFFNLFTVVGVLLLLVGSPLWAGVRGPKAGADTPH